MIQGSGRLQPSGQPRIPSPHPRIESNSHGFKQLVLKCLLTFKIGIPFTASMSVVSGSVCFAKLTGSSRPDPVNAFSSLLNEKKDEGSKSRACLSLSTLVTWH